MLPEIAPQDLSGKIVIITVANTGIGYEIAKSIASMRPTKLILACRDLAKANNAVQTISKETHSTVVEAWELDLASFASVNTFAKKFIATGLPLHLLVDNAGLNSNGWVVTADGYEVVSQVNHLSHALLTFLLAPALQRAPSARVVVVASGTHYGAAAPTVDDPTPLKTLLTKPKHLPFFFLYPASKFLNVLFVKEFAHRNPHSSVQIFAADPGYTKSELIHKDAADPNNANPRVPDAGMPQRPTYEGAKTIIYAAIDPRVGKSGAYYADMAEAPVRSSANNKEFTGRVWRETVEILKKHTDVAFEGWIEK